MKRAMFLILGAASLLGFASAQDAPKDPAKPVSEIDRLVESGSVSALEGRLKSNTPDDLAKLAQAARNLAKRERAADKRDKLYVDAEKRYLKLIDALEKAKDGDAAKRTVERARAHSDLAGMIMSNWVSGDLDRFEISDGRLGDRKDLAAKLTRARDQYNHTFTLIDPLYEQRERREDEFLSLDIMDDVKRIKLDTDVNLGFSNLYMAQVAGKDAPDRGPSLLAAQKKFQDLIDTGRTGPEMYQVHFGLGVTLRELGKLDDAIRQLRLAMDEGADPVIVIQSRYELARAHIASEKFEEARTALEPLLKKDPENLPAEERGARFHVNLAKLWDANSYLIESDAIRRTAENSPAKTAILNSARQSRETGLSKMNRLASSGGPWPQVVKLYVADSIKTGADPKMLNVIELKMAAAKLSEEKKLKEAQRLLTEAAARPGTEPALAGDVLYDLALCHYQQDDLRSAGQTFHNLAVTYKTHDKSPKAIEFAYKCWGKVAEDSKNKDDYARAADSLKYLVENYPTHESRAEAVWFLPLALQASGKYDDAVKRYLEIPKDSPRWEEAQFRKAVCARLAFAAKRDSLSAEDLALEARKAARLMRDYADEAFKRAGSGEKNPVLNWSAEAVVNAAELLAEHGVERYPDSLEMLDGFEKRYGGGELLGRVLAARIRGHRGMRDFDKASKILEQYLQTVAPEKAGAVLAGLARGMQDEIDALTDAGKTDQARKMAAEAVDIFDQLLKSITGNPARAADAELVSFGLARMLFLAGDLEKSEKIVAELVAKNAKNGNYQRLTAQIQTARLPESATPEQLKAAQESWSALLRDQSLRKRAPQLYWEARYNWLYLHFRIGNAAEVAKAIQQEKVWIPDLGGPPWQAKLEALFTQSGGVPAVPSSDAPAPASGAESSAPQGDSPTTSQPAPPPPGNR